MQIGDIAHVHHAKAQIWQAGQRTIEQFLHHLQAGGKIRPQHRAEHGGRVDAHIFHRPAVGLHPVARRPLGQRLGLDIGIGIERIDVRPVRFGERRGACAMAIGDGRHAAGHHHAADAGGMGKAQCPQGAFAGRHDQLIGVLRFAGRNRRGDVLDEGDAVHRRGPAIVAHQVAGHQLQIGQPEGGAHVVSPRQAADGAAHRPTLGHQRLDHEAGNIAGRAGDQHLAPGIRHRPPSRSCQAGMVGGKWRLGKRAGAAH